MGTRQEWIDARRDRPEWVGPAELRELMLDEDDVGPFAVLVHSGCGDGALICGDGAALARYLSRAAVLVYRRTGAVLRPPAYSAVVEELVNAAVNDVLAWMRAAGMEVNEGGPICSILNVLVNVAVCRAKTEEALPVEAVIRQAWPDKDVETVLGWCAS